MVNSGFHQLDSFFFRKQLDILCYKAKKRKKAQSKYIINNWQGKETFEFAEYKAYQPGDDLRKVDWSIYKRLKEVVVKEYEIEPPKHLVVAIDLSRSVLFYNKIEYIKALAAALVYIGTSLVDKVSFLPFSTKKMHFQSFSNSKNITGFFQYLQNLKTTSENESLQSIFTEKKLLSRHLNVIVLSDFYQDEYYTSLRFFRSPCTAIQIIAKEEIQPPHKGIVHLQDAESNKKQALVIDKDRWNTYQKNFKNHLFKVKNFCWQSNINYLLLEAENDFSSVLSILQIAGIIK